MTAAEAREKLNDPSVSATDKAIIKSAISKLKQ